jgi:selenocysteine lyase/cysteine desulfurase
MTYFNIPGTIRVSFLYNTKEEIDVMVEAVKEQHHVILTI